MGDFSTQQGVDGEGTNEEPLGSEASGGPSCEDLRNYVAPEKR